MSLVRMLCVYTVLASGSAAPVHGDSGQPRVSVEWHQGRLSVNADGVPFCELLAAIANMTGVEVQGLATLEDSASIHFSNLTLRDGLEALLARTNYAMFEEPSAHGGKGRIVVIVVGHKWDSGMPAGQERGRGPQPSEPITADGPDTYQTVERLAEQGDLQALREAAVFGDPTTRALAMQRLARHDPAEAWRVATEAAGSAEATQRVLAVQVLGGLDSPEATDTLGAALQDSDLGVRHAAVVGLMTRTSPAAIQFLVQALQDRAASIRVLALELLAQRGLMRADKVIE
jgi:hypothetical protein